jgi:hypothetical protein
VRGHQSLRAVADRRHERRQLHRAQPGLVVTNDRQIQVRVCRRVSVAGEVFPRAGHAARAQAAPEAQRLGDHRLYRDPEGSVAYDRVFRVGMHIEHRS